MNSARRLAAFCLATGILFVALVLAPVGAFPPRPLFPALNLIASAAILAGALWRAGATFAPRALWIAIGLLLALAVPPLYALRRGASSYLALIGGLYLAAAALTLLLLGRLPQTRREAWHPRHAIVGLGAFAVAGTLLALATWYVLADL